MGAIRDWARRTTLLQHGRDHLRAVWSRGNHPEGIVPKIPSRIVVEPTNACNLACSYCGNKDMLRQRTFMPLPLYERMLDEMVSLGIPRVTLHTIGEPTLHPRIAEMIRMAVDRGRFVAMSTNGTRFEEPFAREIVRAGPDVLNFSADSADAAAAGALRAGLDVEQLIEALRRVRRIRDEEGPLRETPWGLVRVPTLTLTCVLTTHFDRAMEHRYFEVFEPLVDDWDFHPPCNHGGKVGEEHLPVHRRLPKWLRSRVYGTLRRPCPFPWDTLVLLSDGTLSVCRFDLDGKVRIGRFGDESLAEMWNGAGIRKLRRAHMDLEFSDWPSCGSCSAVLYENREEHHQLTRKLMRRNGVRPKRDTWTSTAAM